ncbi:hypothetical protein M409DRAFT_28901 [Zasmidium cellare ATCC 36951]|uniref:THO complex subunit 2 n=1 Tax=Zasmidium cellare ATCC 36951 TaxID=1080233 RepID=A0A6A6C5U7_ZASCE|nr:uncharacterized protein M409DRAFT_28901 [Zasmidium cellare ATCC 36951]KAF2160766.1 hypothetical protein M409DRAFT_28901 [Zasmidium cellare ATCC 36951]
MAPSSNKRKRPERQISEDDGASRPSPYKPEKSRMTRRTSQQIEKAETTGEEDAAPNMRKIHDCPAEDKANNLCLAATSSSREGTGTPAQQGLDNNPSEPNGHGHSTGAPTAVPVKALYKYTHVTDDIISSWSDSGKQTIVDAARGLDELRLSDLFSELVRSSLEDRLAGKQAGLAVRDIIASQDLGSMSVEELFLNTISFLYDANYKGPQLRPLVASTGIDLQRMREELDIPLLQELGLVRSTFDKMRTRKTTNALYRQANFNLLREESEGYAKLITEYFNTAQEASSRRDDDPFMAEDAFRRVEALIGAFDLDVGRVLDIIMDVSANLLVKAYPFFIKFYRASSWWPDNELLDNVKWEDQGFSSLPSWALPGSGRWVQSDDEKEALSQLRHTRDVRFWDHVREAGMDAFFELGSKKIVNFDSVLPLLQSEVSAELDARGKETNPNKRMRLNEVRKYMRETRSIPPSGNYDAAQLLGFKLRFYASDARDAGDTLPDNLIYLAALLIKIGFISLRDLYPHLYPADEDMPKERARLEKEKAEKEAKERPGGGMNALLMAGALADDSLPGSRRIDKEKSGDATPSQDKKDEPKEELPAPVNQKVLLLKALLLIGALPEALHLLGRFPWLAEVDISLPAFLQRLARHMLSKVAESLHPLSSRDGLQEPREQLSDTTPRFDGSLAFSARQPKKTTRWLYNDVFDKDDGQDYRHYYSDWSDNIPVCQSLDDVFALCNTFLGYIGPKIGQDVALYSTLLRLAYRSLTDDTSNENRSRWLELMKRLLVPALSCSKHNPQLAQHVYELLSFFPVATRYKVYAEWFTGRTSRLPDVQAAFAKNKAEVRDVLRRVSNDYVKKQSRALGKVALSSPGIVMMEMINQLESYNNMIPSLVECTRYFSSLAYDVLNWALINSVSGQGRDRMQADGMLTSSWLQALSRFVASLFTRYSHLNLSPILQYLASELRSGNSTDLELFEQVLVEMAGIRSDTEFNDSQVLAMAGGETLRTHILSQLSDTRHLKKTSAQRLIAALDKPKLIGQTLVAIAQEQQMYAQHESSRFMPLKVLGNNLDKIQAVFQQYMEVLKYNLDAQKFEDAVPDVTSLVRDFGVGPCVALTVCRAALQHRLSEFDAAKKHELDDKKDASAQNAPAGEDADNTAETIKEEAAHEPTEQSNGVVEMDQEMEGVEDGAAATAQPAETGPWHPVLEPVIQGLQEALPELAARISVPFYVTFWTLNLYDVFVPMDNYSREMKRLDGQINEIASDRSDLSAIQSRERERKKKNLMDLREKMKQEPTVHVSAYRQVKARINKTEKSHWFAKTDGKESRAAIDAKHQGLLQECFIPRAIMSSIDAYFSFTMMKILHDQGTPGFSLMHLLHQLFKKQQLATLMFQCTANEAQHLGRYLCETLKHLHSWHADKTIYEKEALGQKTKLPGFVKAFDENGEPKSVIDYETFRRMLFNFHAHLSNALQACFESDEYMHIRNGIIVLKSVVQVFPAIKYIGKNMVDHVTKLSKDDPRQDLKLAAMSLLGPLKSREKHWLLPQAFRLNDPAKDGAKPTSRAPSARPETPQPGAGLNASAPEFKSTSTTQANGTSRKESVAGGPEDGEIEDEKAASAKESKSVSNTGDRPETPKQDNKATEKEIQRPSHDVKSTVARDTPKADSKPLTPAPIQSRHPPGTSGSQRAEPSRPSSTQPGSARSSAHALPNRPEHNATKPLPGAPTPGRGGRYPARSGPDERFGRLDRPNDVRPASRDHSPGHRTRGRTPPPASTPRGYRDERQFDRPTERPPHDNRGARDEPYGHPRREGPPMSSRPPLDSRDRSQPTGRTSDAGTHPDRLGHISSVAVAPEGQQPSRVTPSATPSQPQSQDDQHHVNPARMALIDSGSGGPAPRRGRDAPPADRDPRRERESRTDDRPGSAFGSRTAEAPRDAPPRNEQQPDLAPTGPKRAGGRLREMAPPQQTESNFGRLNGPQDAPSGPRQLNGSGRGARNFTAPVNTRPNDSAVPSPTTGRPPESPAALRGPPSRQPSGPAPHVDRSAPSSAPSTPAAENGPQVHPSRAAQFAPPAPIQTSFQAPNGPRNAGSPTTGPPAGPRAPGRGGPPSGTPTGPSPANSMPPSGPASGLERRKHGGDRQRQNINATLQGNSNAPSPTAQGVNFRGASSRQPSMSSLPPSGPGVRSGGSVPTVASSMEPPSNQAETMTEAGDEKKIGVTAPTVVVTQAGNHAVTLSTRWLVLHLHLHHQADQMTTEIDVAEHRAMSTVCRGTHQAVTAHHENVEGKRGGLVARRQTILEALQEAILQIGNVVDFVQTRTMVAGEVAERERQADRKTFEVEHHHAKMREAEVADLHATTAPPKAGSGRMMMALDFQETQSGGEAQDSARRETRTETEFNSMFYYHYEHMLQLPELSSK